MTSQTLQANDEFGHIRAPNWNNGVASSTMSTQISSFRDFRLSKEMFEALEQVKYEIPTPVQSASIPLVMAGIDLIVQSRTGTGKTAAFAIPALEALEPGSNQVEVLILCPTRELAQQVSGEFERLGTTRSIDVTSVYGGTGYEKQLQALKTAQVVAATPGRMLDLLKRKAVNLRNLKLFILDEADEMLNMGFEKELNAIVEFLPDSRQNLLFSATVDEDIKNLSSHILSYPEFVTFSGDGVAAQEVEHNYYMVTGLGRLRDLIKIIEYEKPENAIIFANTRDDTFLVSNFLKTHNYTAEVLNGDLPQRDRERTLAKLRKNEIQYLVATDVAARGIDISDLSHVLNLQLPDSPEVYVHRTGRTGRAGKQGIAISLIAPREIGAFYVLKRLFKVEFHERELPTHEELIQLKKERVLEDVIEKLNHEQSLDYATFLEHVEKLLAEDDAATHVAKLMAYFHQGAPALTFTKALPMINKARPIVKNDAPKEDAPEPQAAQEAKPEPKKSAPPKERPTRAKRRTRSAEEEAPVVAEVAAPEVEEAKPEPKKAKESAPKAKKDEKEKKKDKKDDKKEKKEKKGDKKPKKSAKAKEDKDEEKPARSKRQTSSAKAKEEATDDAPAPRRTRRHREIPPAPTKAAKKKEPKKEAKEPKKANAPKKAKEPKKSERQPELAEEVKNRVFGEKSMSRIHLNLGRSKLETPEEAIDLVCQLAGIEPDDCGEATLRSRWCYVQVREDMVDDIIEALNGQKVSNVTLKASVARH